VKPLPSWSNILWNSPVLPHSFLGYGVFAKQKQEVKEAAAGAQNAPGSLKIKVQPLRRRIVSGMQLCFDRH
jgi:hypothetical protein